MDHIQTKLTINDFLNTKGFSIFLPETSKGDYRLFFKDKTQILSLVCSSDKFMREFSNCVDGIKSLLPKFRINIFGKIARISNPDWELSPPIRQSLSRNSKFKHSTNGATAELLDEKPSQVAHDFLAEEIISHLGDLNFITERLSLILDEFTLKRLAVREIFGGVYDVLKASGIECYDTTTPVKILGNHITIPHIARDDFISIAIRSVKKA
jgi:hypothetical protein